MAERRKQLIKAQTLVIDVGGAEGAGSTTQTETENDPWTPEGAITPPENLEALAKATGSSGVRRSCIAAVVHNTVGLGHDIEVLPDQADEQAGEDEPREVMDFLDACARRDPFLHKPNLTRLFAAVKWDEQEVGNGYIEVSRNRRTGKIDGLFHVPGKRIRRKADRSGWVMGPRSDAELSFTTGGSTMGGQVIEFCDFGSKVEYERDGTPKGKLAKDAKSWATNELIPFQVYTSESRDYGLPVDAHLAVDYLGDKLAADSNVGYFDNSGVPPSLIFVTPQETDPDSDEDEIELEVSPDTIQAITDTLKAGGPVRHKVAVIPLPAGARAEKIDLAVLSDRDIGFVQFRADNRRRTVGAFRISPIFVADIEDAGKYTAEVERYLTKEQVFDPEQRRWEDILGQTLLRELGKPHLRFRFNQIAIEGDAVRRESAKALATENAITRGEYRESHGFPPLPEASEGAEPGPGEVPFGWNGQLVGASDGQPIAMEEPEPEPLDKSELESEIQRDFESSVAEAIRSVQATADGDYHLNPVVIEKDGDRITVTPVAA